MTVKLKILKDEPALEIKNVWKQVFPDKEVEAGFGINPMTRGKRHTIAMTFEEIPKSFKEKDWFGSDEYDPDCDYRLEIKRFDYNVDIDRLYKTVFQFLKGHVKSNEVHIIDEENLIDYLLTDKQKKLCGVN